MSGAPRHRGDVHATHWSIPTQDFTPLEFEEIVDLFKEFDKDKSGYIDEEELCEMMRALEMDHSLAKAKEMMLEIDEDGSGELEFGEFCALLAKVKRGDVGNLHGFAKLTEDIKATPVRSRRPVVPGGVSSSIFDAPHRSPCSTSKCSKEA